MDSDNGWVKGEWGQPGHLQNPTNVTRLARAIEPEDDDDHPQIVYYQAGVGTGIGLWSHLVGGGTGLGLADNVREAYSFLANNYSGQDDLVPSDSIFLLGFSRGAYTARTLGGFVCQMGILKKKAMSHFYECFEDWERAGDPHYSPRFFDAYLKHHHDLGGDGLALKIKEIKEKTQSSCHKVRDAGLDDYFKLLQELDLTQRVTINAIGVWETVGALGIPVNPRLQRIFPFLPNFFRTYSFFDTRLHPSINNAYHALALDEHRSPYSPAVWELQDNGTTNLEQTWFAGAHSNIGGSYEDSGIADITLAWMMDRLAGNMLEDRAKFQARDWIKFDENYIKYWYNCQTDWLTEHPSERPHRGWGMGTLYDSYTFPQSLAGHCTRRPGRYHGTFYENGKQDPDRLLDRTNEHIHSSVRARMDMGGRDVEPDWSQAFPHGLEFKPWIQKAWLWITGRPYPTYRPQGDKGKKGPLKGWELKDDHGAPLQPNDNLADRPGGLRVCRWEHEGADELKVRTMPEAKLGDFERKLLEMDRDVAEQIEFGDNGWWWWLKKPTIPTEHGRTM